MASDEESSNESSSDKENSATDIPTDSEFDHDDRTPTGDIPAIMLNDMNITKTRGSGNYNSGGPRKVQVKSGELQRPINSHKTGNIELKFTPIPATPVTQKISSPDITNVTKITPLVNPRKGDYLLNRTQSTGGIASKVSLELKKKYLLGSTGLPGNIQKSGSTTTLDSKLKSVNSTISDYQKLLNPAPEISPTMQAFLQGTSKIRTPLSPTTIAPKSPTFPADNKFEHVCGVTKLTDKPKTFEQDVDAPKQELKSPEIIDITNSPNDKFAMQPDITKDLLPEDIRIETCESPQIVEECQPDIIYTNDTEGRPRSPVHETSIIVPEIPWDEINKPEKKSESDIDTDSLSSEISEELEKNVVGKVFSDIPRVEVHDTSGELLQEDDIAMDSLCIVPENIIPEQKEEPTVSRSQPTSLSDMPKSILSEKKTLNQPKMLPALEPGLECGDITKSILESKKDTSESKDDQSKLESKTSSGRNTPISDPESAFNDVTTAALTETELSDWARDGAVSDNLEDVEFDINPESKNRKLKSKKKNLRSNARIAMVEDFEDTGHVCGRDRYAQSPEKMIIPVIQNGAPIADLDSIEYMDTGSEVSLEENLVQTTNIGLLKNRGYIHFVNEEETTIPVDCVNPVIPQEIINNNETVEAVNKNIILPLSSVDQNTGYCVYGNENEQYQGKFANEEIEIAQNDTDELKQKQTVCDNEEDSLLVVETGTTTEENTVSDSTVKNLIDEPVEEKISELPEEKQEKEEVIAQPDMESKEIGDTIKTPTAEEHNGIEYDEHVKRLQSKYVEFGFVRDSIDVRKSKRKSKADSPPLLPEAKEVEESSPKRVISPTFSSPATSRKIEEINKERSKQHDLIRELVLDKVKQQKRSAEKKRRLRDSFSPSCSPVRRNFELKKSATVDITPNVSNTGSPKHPSLTSSLSTSATKNAETKSHISLQRSPTVSGVPEKYSEEVTDNYSPVKRTEIVSSAEIYTPVTSLKDLNPRTLARPLSMHGSFIVSTKPLKPPSPIYTPVGNVETFSLPDIHQSVTIDDFRTPVAPPRHKHEEAKRTAEKLKQDARARARLMSDEDLGLSPEDRMNLLRQKASKLSAKKNNIQDCIQDSIEALVINTEKRNAMLFNDTLKKKKHSSKKSDGTLQNSFSNSDLTTKLSLYNEDGIERSRTKSVSEICKTFNAKSFDEDQLNMSLSSNMIHRSDSQKKQQFYKSEPNLLTETGKKEKKPKDRERRKSIIKSVTEFFQKKKDPKDSKSPPNSSTSSGSVKERFSRFRISPKSKEKSKVSFHYLLLNGTIIFHITGSL